MEGRISPDATLDYVEFHIFPSQNRYEASVWSSNREEKVASGWLEQLLLYSPEIQNLSSKGSNTKVKMLPPDSINDIGWFTTATLIRFLHIIGLPAILSIGKEISQLEETRKFQLSLSVKAEVDISKSTGAKNELLLAVDLRLTALKEELAAAFNKSIIAKCSSKDISDLRNLVLHFGAKVLRDSLQKSVEMSTVPYKSATDDEDSTFSREEDQPSVERSRASTRSAIARRSASPMRRFQLGRSGSRRAAALSIKSYKYFPSREKSVSQRDAVSNSSTEEEDSDRPPNNNILRMSVQDKISLFETKQKDQVADIQKTKTSNVTVCANKAVLKRWSSGMGERVAQFFPDETSPSSPKIVAPDGKTDPDSNIFKTETCDETDANITLLSLEKEASEQLRVDANALEPERVESKEKHPASNERSQQKEAELNGLLVNLMESKPVRPRKMTSDNSKNNIPTEQRGGLYDLYKKKREEKLQREATGERVEKDSEFKLMLQPANERKAKMGSIKVTGANKRHPSLNEPQKTQKNSTQLINSRTTKTSVVKKSTSKSSPLPAAQKSWLSTPSPAKTPTGPTFNSSTPKNHTPQSSASVVHSSTKYENLQPRLKTLKATQPDADNRIEVITEKKLPTVTENRKTRKTNIQTSKANNTDASKPSFYNKVTRKSSVIPLETKPFLRKGSGIGPVVIRTKVAAEPEETPRSSGGMIKAKEFKMARRLDISSQNQEKKCEMQENDASLDAEPQEVISAKCDESEDSGGGGGGNSRAEVSEVNTTTEEELGISPTAWVVNEEEKQDEIIPCEESPLQLASPAKVTKPAGFSRQHVRRSLSQMFLEDINEADIGEWGNAEHPPTTVYQKDPPRGLTRLLKFARKAKADSHLTGLSSRSALSEGEDDAEEPKATRSFFSLSALRGNKTNGTKALHH